MRVKLNQLGTRIKTLREIKGFSQDELARRSGVSRNMIGEIELGRGNPTFKSLNALSVTLGATIQELFGDSPATPGAEGGLQDAIRILARLEGTPSPWREVLLALIFDDKRYLDDIGLPEAGKRAVTSLLKVRLSLVTTSA